jgi:hypothetical protein
MLQAAQGSLGCAELGYHFYVGFLVQGKGNNFPKFWMIFD